MDVRLLYKESERERLALGKPAPDEHVRFLPDKYLFEGEISTYSKYTTIFTYENEKSQSIVIESKEVADMMKRLLNLAWDSAKE